MGFCIDALAATVSAAALVAGPLYAAAHGTAEPTRVEARSRHERAVLDGLRQRRLLDLLRARSRCLLRARPDADRLSDHRSDLLPHRRHLRGGDRDVSGGGG